MVPLEFLDQVGTSVFRGRKGELDLGFRSPSVWDLGQAVARKEPWAPCSLTKTFMLH